MSLFLNLLYNTHSRIKYDPILNIEHIFDKKNILFKQNEDWVNSFQTDFVIIKEVKVKTDFDYFSSRMNVELEVFNYEKSISRIFNFEIYGDYSSFNNCSLLIMAINKYIRLKNNLEELNVENFKYYTEPDFSFIIETLKELKFEQKHSTRYRPGKDDREHSWIEISNFRNLFFKRIISLILNLKDGRDKNILEIENRNSNISKESILFSVLYKFHDYFTFEDYSYYLLTNTERDDYQERK